MALTIRTTEETEKMLDKLTELTNEKASSKALIKGGYIAIEQSKLAEDRRVEIQTLQRELRELKWTVSNFQNAFGDMMKIGKEK
ncbi:hypothetical protein P7F88_25135 [Vibrio hannami]|uniref:hypothetical protein n=1 Tax=Vibrio hannami TaxID=2717094 RepID=UPI0024101C73|nr:hypothetical protein [Vibrio hannami]MDG3089149.1 hypothetical protein [Vibrio hannami]